MRWKLLKASSLSRPSALKFLVDGKKLFRKRHSVLSGVPRRFSETLFLDSPIFGKGIERKIEQQAGQTNETLISLIEV